MKKILMNIITIGAYSAEWDTLSMKEKIEDIMFSTVSNIFFLSIGIFFLWMGTIDPLYFEYEPAWDQRVCALILGVASIGGISYGWFHKELSRK